MNPSRPRFSKRPVGDWNGKAEIRHKKGGRKGAFLPPTLIETWQQYYHPCNYEIVALRCLLR